MVSILAISLLISGCGAGQLFGPTPTPIPTTGIIEGQVIVQGSTAVSDISVMLFEQTVLFQDTYPKSDGSEIKTDANGKYKFEAVEPGKYAIAIEVSVNSGMKCFIFSTAEVEAGNTAVVDFEILSDATINPGWNLLSSGMVRCQFPDEAN